MPMLKRADPSKGFMNSERKLGVTTRFSEIIELKFGKKMPYIALYFTTFVQLCLPNYLGTMQVSHILLFGFQ